MLARLLVPAALCLLVAACSTRVPVVMSGAGIPRMEGVATTTLYTGTFQAWGCRGHYTGPVDAGEAPLVVSCEGGRQGRGVALLRDGAFVSGRVAWAEGGSATITALPPGPAVLEVARGARRP